MIIHIVGCSEEDALIYHLVRARFTRAAFIVISAILLVSSSLFSSTVAYAGSLTCTHHLSNYFDGALQPPGGSTTYTVGTSTLLAVQGGIWCDGNYTNNFMSGWAMVTDSTTSNYAQSGWDRTYNSPTFPRQFSQYTFPGHATPVSNFTTMQAAYGNTFNYWTSSDSNCNCEAMWVGAYRLASTSYNVLATWSMPMGIQDLGEVGDSSDGMIGKAYPNTSHWSYIETEVVFNSWQTFKPTYPVNDHPSIWYLNPTHDCSLGTGDDWCLDTWS